jgi:hypothetical protein
MKERLKKRVETYIASVFLSERRDCSRKCKNNCFSVGFIKSLCDDDEKLTSEVLNDLVKEGKIEIYIKKGKVLFFPCISMS